ncbi:MAG: DUF192 domain-containing protein [Chloroflexi bacterium]|nr:DUF192 domain-containing protein [Chloroflexota bacterium]
MAATAAFFIFVTSGCGGDDDGPVESQVLTLEAPTAEAVPTATSRPQTPVATPSPAPTAVVLPVQPIPTRAPAVTPARTPTPVFTAPAVTVGGITFGAEVAHTPADRVQGLSDRDELAPGTGMLFVFESGVASSFWMKGMRFALDFVWIGADCTVAGTTVNVPPPSSDSDTSPPIFNSPAPAAYAFEINAREVNEYGIEVGDPVSFSGFSVAGAEC